jgi:hypothetical protein
VKEYKFPCLYVIFEELIPTREKKQHSETHRSLFSTRLRMNCQDMDRVCDDFIECFSGSADLLQVLCDTNEIQI